MLGQLNQASFRPQYDSLLQYFTSGYGTTKVKDRGFVETVPQLVVKGVGWVSFIYLFRYKSVTYCNQIVVKWNMFANLRN